MDLLDDHNPVTKEEVMLRMLVNQNKIFQPKRLGFPVNYDRQTNLKLQTKKGNMFNPSDKVICIDDSNAKPALRVGRLYTVAHQFGRGELADHRGREDGGVMLLNHTRRDGTLIRPPYFYGERRFRLATQDEALSGVAVIRQTN